MGVEVAFPGRRRNFGWGGLPQHGSQRRRTVLGYFQASRSGLSDWCGSHPPPQNWHFARFDDVICGTRRLFFGHVV